jgi:hypothetical protein
MPGVGRLPPVLSLLSSGWCPALCGLQQVMVGECACMGVYVYVSVFKCIKQVLCVACAALGTLPGAAVINLAMLTPHSINTLWWLHWGFPAQHCVPKRHHRQPCVCMREMHCCPWYMCLPGTGGAQVHWPVAASQPTVLAAPAGCWVVWFVCMQPPTHWRQPCT